MFTSKRPRNFLWMARAIPLLLAVALAACGGGQAAKPPLTQQRPLESLLRVAAYPNSDDFVLLVTMQELLATHRERQGYDYFGKLAREQPERRALLHTLQAVMQARLADEVPLFNRVAWVEDAIRKLDAGAAADPVLGRFARGLVFADLPERFGKTRQAVADLNESLRQRAKFPVNLDRGIYRALAVAYRKLGEERSAQEMRLRSGTASLDDPADPRILSELSVDRVHGFRFSEPRLVREADGVYVAEGYDFANIAFIVSREFVVAIDAGTTEPSARAAVSALRQVTHAPIKYVILTHGHWDHVGGLAAVREPGSVVIAQTGFPKQLAHARLYPPPFRYFFGTEPSSYDVKPDRLIATRERLSDGDLDLELIPARSGETEDALFIRDARHDILFVGDAFMPYVGAPFVAEGSAEGYIGAIEDVLALHPRRVIHGHPPLTALYTPEVLSELRRAFGALYARSVAAARAARPLSDVLHDDFIPDGLRGAPKAVLPYLVARDTFVQRVYAEHAGYWRANGEGVEHFTRAEWALALDALGGNSEKAFARVADDLERRGDAALALQIAELGLLRYPSSSALQGSRTRALSTLRQVNSQLNPFRFIVYSELAGRGLPPVSPPARPGAS